MSETVMLCGECGEPLTLRILDRWPSGEIREATWTCGHDDHQKARGWYCDGGTLDLGLVTDEQLEEVRVKARNEWKS